MVTRRRRRQDQGLHLPRLLHRPLPGPRGRELRHRQGREDGLHHARPGQRLREGPRRGVREGLHRAGRHDRRQGKLHRQGHRLLRHPRQGEGRRSPTSCTCPTTTTSSTSPPSRPRRRASPPPSWAAMAGIPRTSTSRPPTAGSTPTTTRRPIPGPRSQNFLKAYGAKFKDDQGAVPDALAALAYDATNLLLQAIKDAGADDTDKVKVALEKINFNGVSGDDHLRRAAQPREVRRRSSRSRAARSRSRPSSTRRRTARSAASARGQPRGCPLLLPRRRTDART